MKRNLPAALLPLAILSYTSSAASVTTNFRIEAKANYRDSEAFATPLNLIPNTFLSTVDPGAHYEISTITVHAKTQLSENWRLLTKVDFIDLYERNPTSGDKTIDLDTFALRYGTKHANGLLPETTSYYGQIGKFGKFERQEDRHLESYGLVSTAFNRLEDTGVEFGLDLTSGFYGKLSYTTGAPVFLRDPNALAGDNGVDLGDPNPEYNSGFGILYDAEVEDFDLSGNPEFGAGIGWRWVSENGVTRFNVLAHYNERKLADTVDLKGTQYGGDIDLLVLEPAEFPAAGLTAAVGLPITNDSKEERGLTVWLYHDSFALFAQYVDQDLAGLERDGWELELSYSFAKVLRLKSITPVVRYSTLRPNFVADPLYLAPSVTWDWDKIDYGINFDFNDNVKLTMEHADNEFIRGGNTESYGETLLTLYIKYDF